MNARLVLLAFVLASLPSVTLAQQTTATPPATAPEEHDAEARALFDAGQIAYTDGRYEAALQDFVQAHDLSGRPELLYNIALAAERLRHDQEALDAYEQFLAARPDTSMHAAIESRIQILRTAIAEHSTPPPPAEVSEEPESQSPPPAPEPPPSSGPDVGALTLTIGGGVVTVAGVVLLALSGVAAAHVSGASYPAAWSDYHADYDNAQTFSIAGGVLAGVGAAALVAGIVWLAVGSGSHSADVAIGPSGLTLRGTF